MARLSMFLILALAATVSLAGELYEVPQEIQGYQMTKEIQDYLEGLKLVRKPAGVEARALDSEPGEAAEEDSVGEAGANASIRWDFNGDGKEDFAGLYSYTGPEYRGENLHLDLIIVFTVGDSYEHRIYEYVARRSDDRQRILASVSLRGPGRVDEVHGEFDLQGTAIQVDRGGGDSLFFFWDGEDFTAVDTDD